MFLNLEFMIKENIIFLEDFVCFFRDSKFAHLEML